MTTTTRDIPKAGRYGMKCLVCRRVKPGPVAEVPERGPKACICLDCIEQFVGWLKRWRPVIRRYRRTGKMYVRPSEMTKRAA